ncbi:MAG: MCP four helix bundle domain-containing protein [Nevskia sp.]|nr:MCP four helix bundle domain-containing protein [Nevskia sp.]
MQKHSIRSRLSWAFMIFRVLVLVLGLFSIWRLNDVNRASAEIRDRWLQSTRLLGDLNNYTSDYRAAEASHLLSQTAAEMATDEQELASLEKSISAAQHSYERLPHDAAESGTYARFAADWERYREAADHVLALSRVPSKAEATALFKGVSRAAYGAASDTLGVLTARSVASAKEASDRAEVAYLQARALIVVAILVAGIMTVAVMRHITRSILLPILELAERMHALAVNRMDIEVSGTQRRDEIGEMARAVTVFRNNAIELAQNRRGLEQQASMLEEKLQHEQRLTTLQRNFVSMASHEFRTPLTIIDGQAQRLIKNKDSLSGADIAERAARIRAAVLRMTSLIDSQLHSARLFEADAGLYFHPEEFDPAALLREICQLHREIAGGIQILELFHALPPLITGDPKLLHQAFSNLLGNAIKYSPDGGPIKVQAGAEGDGISVSIQDRGVGIPAQDMQHLFERYYRGSNVRGIVGTGVGLYLVKVVVDLHGGRIAVESTEGHGSRFVVHLPLRPPQAGEAAPGAATEQDYSGTLTPRLAS